MKIIDKEFQLLGQEMHVRIVPKTFRSHLSKVGILLFNGNWREAEMVLDQMREDFCPDYCQDDIDMIPFRREVDDLKRELMV